MNRVSLYDLVKLEKNTTDLRVNWIEDLYEILNQYVKNGAKKIPSGLYSR